ncbi:MAG TPA: NAD(P)-dependent oxidoreductase [Gemmatimonadota bacterium]|nr:NAD(P)-dependent oxidoreductase [Gemmatimonadota bacterium]
MNRSLAGRTVLVTGASRGIGRAIALRAARDGANVVIVAKTSEPHPKLPGTIHTVAGEVEAAGGRALALEADVRDVARVEAAVARAVQAFGGLDVLVNNAGAIRLTGTLDTPVERFDLVWAVNARAMFTCSRACLPHLLRSGNPHVLSLSPPLSLDPRWIAPHAAYTLSKYGMSLLVIGMAAEFADRGVAFNALWPRTVIATAALAMLAGRVRPENCRSPEIVADAAHAIVTRDSRACSGRLMLDEEVLMEEGLTDFDRYRIDPRAPLAPDLFVSGK